MATKTLHATRRALRIAKRGAARTGAISLVSRAERAITSRNRKRAAACLAALVSAAINFPSATSKRAAVATIVGVLVDAKTLGINLRRIGIGWERNRRCSLKGDRRCFASKRNTCFQDPTGCISTPGSPPSILLASKVAPGIGRN